MELYTLIVVGDERSPVRRFQVPKLSAQRALLGAFLAGALVLSGLWDYWRLRAENGELPTLRIEAQAQADRIRSFEQTVASLRSEVDRVRDLERKVRIIANLPGATASGGVEVTDRLPDDALLEGEESLQLPLGVPGALPGATGPQGTGRGGPEAGEDALSQRLSAASGLTGAHQPAGVRRLATLEGHAGGLSQRVADRSISLADLMVSLEAKRDQLASLPSVWPTKGWLTSRFGPRVSPFTGRRHLHAGIDVAARQGTPVIAPARGRVTFTGRKGPLGNSVTLDHGYGVRTIYGHNHELFVKTGDTVERGDKIASVGSTGRSTGPHLHYSVKVNDKAKNPLDYIFD